MLYLLVGTPPGRKGAEPSVNPVDNCSFGQGFLQRVSPASSPRDCLLLHDDSGPFPGYQNYLVERKMGPVYRYLRQFSSVEVRRRNRGDKRWLATLAWAF